MMDLLLQNAVDGEVDPEDDPNNQGEDEFEEAEDERRPHRAAEEEEEGGVEEEEEPAAPAQQIPQRPEQPAADEELVVSWGGENGAKDSEQRESHPSEREKPNIWAEGKWTSEHVMQIAGNPDQQEDTLDDQYQEEAEDEVTWIQTLSA